MAYREFTDSTGIHWQAWDVIPSSAERRRSGERRFGDRPTGDRRVHKEFRVQMGDELARGWLVFECQQEKRRLMPIPPGWDLASDEELCALRDAATATSRPATP